MTAIVSEAAGVEMVRLFLERGADVNAIEPEDNQNMLELAVRQGTLEKVEALLDAGADIHYQSEGGYNVLISAMHSRAMGEGEPLLPLVELLLARGASPLGESDWGESALSVSSHEGRFDVVERLLAAGADVSLLEWDELHRAVALGSVADVERLLAEGAELTARDRWERTPWLLSLQIGALDKAELLLAAGADLAETGNCGQTPLMHAIKGDHVEVLSWLIEQGVDLNAKDEFGGTALMMAAEQGATECVRRLLQAGARADLTDVREGPAPDMRTQLEEIDPDLVEGLDADFLAELGESSGQKAIEKAANLDIVRLLVEAGEDLGDLSDEMRAELTGLQSEGAIHCSREEYLTGKYRRFGTANPEVMDSAFWRAMVKSGATAYTAKATFDDTENLHDGPVWCFHRFGKSITELPDGRIIEIGGEHEDYYDADFCIYNDVFVHYGGGEFEILGYPEEAFPPTDFHSATLVGEFIYIIGCLGYPAARVSGETPVYRLHCETLAIEKVETGGDKPGWINNHRARHEPGDSSGGEIRIWGGKVCADVDGEEDYFDNPNTYVLNLSNMSWKRVEKE
jgi:ankyrin repeat protein